MKSHSSSPSSPKKDIGATTSSVAPSPSISLKPEVKPEVLIRVPVVFEAGIQLPKYHKEMRVRFGESYSCVGVPPKRGAVGFLLGESVELMVSRDDALRLTEKYDDVHLVGR